MNLNKKTVITLLIALIGFVLLAFYLFGEKDISAAYRTAKVDRGEVSSYVTATGTVNPITTVEIGSQVPGVVREVYVDFNSQVRRGDPLVKIDAASFQSKLGQAEANLRKADADAELARAVLDANEELYRKRLISKQEYDDSKAEYSAAVAALEQAKAELEIAKANLYGTTTRSPLDGTVISKNVNVGQTVAPGRDSSVLFVIAEDLARMQVDTYVSEADIGKIEVGQKAEFTVDAYPNLMFEGNVRQIRNDPATNNDIVTYDVVVLINNEDRKLKPGMTAEVRILTAHKENALRVPRAALRFIPPPSALINTNPEELDSQSVVWMTEKDNRLNAVSINPGISGDTFTEVLDGDLKEGQEVVVEALETGESDSELGPVVLPKPQRF